MKDNEGIAIITELLKNLDSSTTWFFVSLAIILVATITDTNTDKIKVGEFDIPKKYADIFIFSFLIALNLKVIKLLYNLKLSYEDIQGLKEKIMAKQVISRSAWLFNPFSDSASMSIGGQMIEVIGYPLLLLMWFIGYSLAFKYHRKIAGRISYLSTILFAIYLLLIIGEIFVINRLITEMNVNATIRLVEEWIFIAFGIFLFFTLNFEWVRQKLPQKLVDYFKTQPPP